MPSIDPSTGQTRLRSPGSDASPSIYLERLFSMRYYAWTSAKHSLESASSGTVLGQLWLLIEPAIQIAIYWFVFGVVLEVDRGTENFIAFLTVGQVVFRHSQRGITQASSALVNSPAILKSLSFPRAVLPLSQVLNALANHRFGLLVMLVVLPFMGVGPRWSWILIIPLTALQVVMNFGLGLFLARAVTRFTDIRFALVYLFQLLLYASGVFYPLDRFVADRSYGPLLLDLFTINPFYSLIGLARGAMFGTRPGTAGLMLISVIAWTFGSMLLGFFVFLRGERDYSGVRTVSLPQ